MNNIYMIDGDRYRVTTGAVSGQMGPHARRASTSSTFARVHVSTAIVESSTPLRDRTKMSPPC
jgi:hypothetical protein